MIFGIDDIPLEHSVERSRWNPRPPPSLALERIRSHLAQESACSVTRRLAFGPFGTTVTSSPVTSPRLLRKEVMNGLADVQGEARDDRGLRLLLDQAQSGVALKSAIRVPPRTVDGKPTASATIEPVGPRTRKPRRHAVRVILRFTGFEPKFADRSWVLGTAESALAAVSPSIAHEAPTFGDVLGKTSNVLGIEGVMVCADKPEGLLIDQIRQVLVAAGYSVAAREVRECSESDCTTTALVDCARPTAVPGGWHSADVCGRHGYKPCAVCGSTYVMSCSNATSAAPSVHCEVCGEILVEWGGTKLWTANLVRRADWPRAR